MSLCFDIILVYTVVFCDRSLTLSAFLQICFLLLRRNN